MIKAIKTTGKYRVPSTVKGENRHSLSCELKDGFAWIYEDKDGPYSKLIWEMRAPTPFEAFDVGRNYKLKGGSFQEDFYVLDNLSKAWVAGYNSV